MTEGGKTQHLGQMTSVTSFAVKQLKCPTQGQMLCRTGPDGKCDTMQYISIPLTSLSHPSALSMSLALCYFIKMTD